MRFYCGLLFVLLLGTSVTAQDGRVTFTQNKQEVDKYSFLEVKIAVAAMLPANPFTDVLIQGECTTPSGKKLKIDGFCDSNDGQLHRLRILASEPGAHTYSVNYKQGMETIGHTGKFTVKDNKRKGLVRIDPQYPAHFIWEGTKEHYFWNGTTTYWLLGWKEDVTIRRIVNRLDELQVNRLRVALAGRTKDGGRWSEPLVKPSKQFQLRLEPWVAKNPENIEKPEYDVTRFNLDFWKKVDGLLEHTRKSDMVVSLIFYLDGQDPGVDPFGMKHPGSQEEERYYRYAIARCAAYSNVMWDVTNEWHLFRTEDWVKRMGNFLKANDPYQHLVSVHGSGKFPFRKEPWADFALYQSWDEHGGYNFMLKNKKDQEAAGRVIPQINEEYGYEDHYPQGWGENRKAPSRNGENRRKLAWLMYMAGGYQTTGERADQGTGAGNDSGGGWLNGRGDSEMTMLPGYAHIRKFFQGTEWWKTNPDKEYFPEADDKKGPFVLSEKGRQYIVYLPEAEKFELPIPEGRYEVRSFHCVTGEWSDLGVETGPQKMTLFFENGSDRAIYLKKK